MFTISLLASAILSSQRGNISLTSCKHSRGSALHMAKKPSTPKPQTPGPWNNTPSQQKIIERIVKKGAKIFY